MPDIVRLPTLHTGQAAGYRALRGVRFRGWRCGRRFGKDVVMITRAADAAAKGRAVGLFAPEHKQLVEPYDQLEQILWEIKARRGCSRSEGRFQTRTGGVVDLWPLNDNLLAGRGREYDQVHINEAAFTKRPQMLDTWRKAIRPTLLVRGGSADVYSTPNGIDETDFFWNVCENRADNSEYREFVIHHAPTSSNPLIPATEIERERQINHPLVFRQEFLAEFVDWSGAQFFELAKWLVDGQPVPYPARCDSIIAVVDTALKDGKEHDATGVTYCAYTAFPAPGVPNKLVILDWDKVQIEGAFLENWLPAVYQRLGELADLCGARTGPMPPFIEDKGSGTVLLQQARRRGWRAEPLPEALVAQGKEGRALSVSGYHHRELCKISQYAYDKMLPVKGITRNHQVSEVMGFRLGDKDAHKRADELLDTYCYTLAVALGDSEGY